MQVCVRFEADPGKVIRPVGGLNPVCMGGVVGQFEGYGLEGTGFQPEHQSL